MAALCAGVSSVSVAILETDEDLLLHAGTEMLRLTPPSRSIIEHKQLVYDMVVQGTEAAIQAERLVPAQLPLFRAK